MIGDLEARTFTLSPWLRKRFEELEPPFQVRQRPSSQLSIWLGGLVSYLRFLDVLPDPAHGWRFSLVFSTRLGDWETCERLLKLDGKRRVVMINLSPGDRLRIEFEAHCSALALEPSSGVILDVGMFRGAWRAVQNEPSQISSLLVAAAVPDAAPA